ncbi:MAG: hypothetical protein CMH55_07550, partial [Myxococcales bacterium]|nr:hypothetical protein [Myxococcales bacterium]
KAGGLAGWYTLPDFSEQMRDTQRQLRRLNGKPHQQALLVARKGRDFVDDLNRAVENGVRLAAFKVALEEGWGEKEAASLAKNLTVNFNRKGEIGNQFGALYLFFNASVQGTFRLLKALRHPKVWSYVGGIAFASAWMDAINRAMGGDDDDGVPYYDKIPDWIKDRNLIVMSPEGNGDRWMIPLPYGYNVFHALGRVTGAVRAGVMEPWEAVKNAVAVAWESFYPLGSEADLAQTLSPTLLDPIIQIGENKTFYGAAIRPEPFDEELVPMSERYWQNVNPQLREITAFLNRLTGGSKVESGDIDLSPEDLEHVFEFAVGGVGREAARLEKTIDRASRGEELLWKDIPILYRFMGEHDPAFDKGRYYRQRDDVRRAEKLVKEAAPGPELAAARRDNALLLRLVQPMKDAESRLRKLRKRRRETEDEAQIKRLDESMEAIRATFSRRYLQVVGR